MRLFAFFVLAGAFLCPGRRVLIIPNRFRLTRSTVREAKAHGEAGNGPKKTRKKRINTNPRGATPAESAKNLVQKKFSRKINYDAFDNLFKKVDLPPQKMSASQLRGSEAPSGYYSDEAADDGKEKADRRSLRFGPERASAR